MKLPEYIKNLTSIFGVLLASVTFLIIVILFTVSFIFDAGSSYIGLFIYIILPIFLIIGLLFIPIGMIFTRRKMKRKKQKGEELRWPKIDFNKPSIRNASILFTIGTTIFIIASTVGSYEAFHYTESVEFCGKLCHKVMKPEYMAYHESSHERVACVDCHVGTGANWYVKSKLSGLYQVYSVIAKKYPKPIATPIKDLRPAREICEHCHWPEKFYDRKLRIKKSYLANEETTEWNIHLKMKTSAQHSALGNQEGIHWHINPDIKIEYAALNKDRQSIPWVKYTNLKTGDIKIYNDSIKLYPEQLDSLEIRVMDCIDCHNRPSHNYRVPQDFIDDAITAGDISRELPDIKIAAMDILIQDYSTTDSAMTAIKDQVLEYYDIMFPEVLETKKKEVDRAILSIQEQYKRNIFPEMKVKWSKYPNHISHLESDGCFRCHNNRHSTENGEYISLDCNLCHEITAQGNPNEMEVASSLEPLEFKHPVDIKEKWRSKLCSECHVELY